MDSVTIGVILDAIQSFAIAATLLLAIKQWKQSSQIVNTNNMSKIISALNDLRTVRIQNPKLERALFESRKEWTDDEIMVRVYNVQFANIFEWVFLSYKNHLLSEKEYNDWSWIWKNVILTNESMRNVMMDKTIYTFCFDAHQEIMDWIGLKK